MERLRAAAIAVNFGSRAATLAEAIHRSGFVQADPIRSPARAQDLILRQRVPGYRVGDLEAAYAPLELEEHFLYAYGYLPRATWRQLRLPARALTKTERRVLDAVAEAGEAHPAVIAAQLGRRRAVNPWGGWSNATTRVLDDLHWRGFLRVSRREKGNRVYAAAEVDGPEPLSPAERARHAVRLLTRVLAPAPESSLRQAMRLLGYCHLPVARTRPAFEALVKNGELRCERHDGVDYWFPVGGAAEDVNAEVEDRVRILAPFDPLVWDRRRFEHLWGWAYRFEAYTPPAKRTMGYYAMPMSWRDRMVGWVNASVTEGRLVAEPGYVSGRAPREAGFKRALEAEVSGLAASLGVR